MDRKEMEDLLRELVVKRLDELVSDVKRIDHNVFLMAEKVLAPAEQKQLKRNHKANNGSPVTPIAQAAKSSR